MSTDPLQGQFVPLDTTTDDDPDGPIRKEGLSPEGFSRMDIRDMDLDERDRHRIQGVSQGDTRMREGRGIEHDRGDPLIDGTMYPLDEFVFGIALEVQQLVTFLSGPSPQAVDDMTEGLSSIVAGFTTPQKIEIRTIEQ